jgi:hypothetical protein
VGYDTHSKGHRVYWKGTNRVTVERSIIFSRDKLPCVEEEWVNIETTDEETIKEGEPVGEEAGAPIHAPPEDTGKDLATVPVNQTLPELRRSEQLHKPSQYVKDIKSGEFLATKKVGELPMGIQETKNGERLKLPKK